MTVWLKLTDFMFAHTDSEIVPKWDPKKKGKVQRRERIGNEKIEKKGKKGELKMSKVK